MRYPAANEGEWIYPKRKGFKLSCCDCGLVHRMNFRVVNGKIEFQVFRDDRATAQIRRKNGNDNAK